MSEEVQGGFSDALGEYASNPPTPRRVGEVIITARCTECGKHYHPSALNDACPECEAPLQEVMTKVSACENRIKAQFEDWVRSRAKRVVQTEPDPEMAARLLSQYTADYVAGKYSWFDETMNQQNNTDPQGLHVRSTLRSNAGFYHMMCLLMRRCDPDLEVREMIEIIDANQEAAVAGLAWALGNSSTPPAKETAGGVEKKQAQAKKPFGSKRRPPQDLSDTERTPARRERNRPAEELTETEEIRVVR